MNFSEIGDSPRYTLYSLSEPPDDDNGDSSCQLSAGLQVCTGDELPNTKVHSEYDRSHRCQTVPAWFTNSKP